MSNLMLRILFALIMVPLVLGVVVLGSWYYWGLVLALALLCWWEFCALLKKRGFYTSAALFGYVFIALIFGRAFLRVDSWLTGDGLLLSFAFLLCIAELWYKEITFSVSRMAVQFFGAAYIGLTTYALYLVGTLCAPGWKLTVPFLLSLWLSDSLAYFTGRFAGKHPLYPAVSPKKTVEGGLGGIAGALLGFATLLIWNHIHPVHVLLLGLITGVTGQAGDFIESLIKRWAGVKDSSNLFPGHGGVLDRIDSLLFAAPFVVFYFRYLL